MAMFCNQCEQTTRGEGCTTIGVCGKKEDVAALQDLLVNACRGIALVAVDAEKFGVDTAAEGAFVADALFTTLTNVDFDPASVASMVDRAIVVRDAMKARLALAGGTADYLNLLATFQPAKTLEGKVAQGMEIGSPWDTDRDDDIQSLQETTLFGMKGVGSYEHHARTLGHTDPMIYSYLFKALAALSDTSLELADWVALALECGAVNLRTMEILDEANTGTYGQPVPTKVPLGHKAGKAILVSGHDLADMDAILKATEGLGIDVYTHGEMLPTHGYPELKKHPHFYGHYGTAWQNQRKEFAEFPGAILMTTNCIQAPEGRVPGEHLHHRQRAVAGRGPRAERRLLRGHRPRAGAARLHRGLETARSRWASAITPCSP